MSRQQIDGVRRRLKALAGLLIAELTHDVAIEEATVRTPRETTECLVLAGRIAAVPIMRAGLVLVDLLLDFIREAEVRHLGMHRDEAMLSRFSIIQQADGP